VQFVTSTEYVSTTMNGDPTFFGVNFADGRIKGYPQVRDIGGSLDNYYVRYVRGNPAYGVNDFEDLGDGTVADHATGLVWQKGDSGEGMEWEDALSYCEGLELSGSDDWRLPDAKELHSIVDYLRSPDTTGSAAIDPVFDISSITDDGGDTDYPYFWSSTTHKEGPPDRRGQNAVYFAFGEAEGFMESPPGSGSYTLMDVHGAGAQRSDPKTGDPADYPNGHGPQGDVIRIFNHVRCVRTAG
jgi:hypothetical protein